MINNLVSPKTKQKAIRVGRGYGSKRGGHTTGKGTKGQRSRSGYRKPRPGFEGGQNPISRRLPKFKGFSRAFFDNKVKPYTVKLSRIAEIAKSNDVIDFDKLVELNIVKPHGNRAIKVKVVFDKEISKKLQFKQISLSESALNAVKKAGGNVEE